MKNTTFLHTFQLLNISIKGQKGVGIKLVEHLEEEADTSPKDKFQTIQMTCYLCMKTERGRLTEAEDSNAHAHPVHSDPTLAPTSSCGPEAASSPVLSDCQTPVCLQPSVACRFPDLGLVLKAQDCCEGHTSFIHGPDGRMKGRTQWQS